MYSRVLLEGMLIVLQAWEWMKWQQGWVVQNEAVSNV